MSRPHLKISVPEPCSESWAEMTPEGRGRFCAACAKTVVDFSQFTDKELLAYFTGAGGKVCGRFAPAQLNRPVYTETSTQLKFFPQVFAAVALFLGISSQSQAQRFLDHPTPSSVIQKPENTNPGKTVGKTPEKESAGSLVLAGRVIDSLTHEPIPFCPVVEKSLKIVAMTDISGAFQLLLPDTFRLEKVTIETRYVGYRAGEFEINRKDLPLTRDIEMAQDWEGGVLTGITVTDLSYRKTPAYYLRHSWWKTRNLFRKKEYTVDEE